MTKYKIEKNIPRPITASVVRNRYEFGKMEVDDSFYIEPEDVLLVRPAATWYGVRNGMKFSIRKWKDGYRCWRIA